MRPRHPGNEQQRYRCEHDYKNDVLTITYYAGKYHRKEHTRQNVWQHEPERIAGTQKRCETEHPRHNKRDVSRNHCIHHEIRQGTAKHSAEHSVIIGVVGKKRTCLAAFAGRADRKSHSQQQRLLYYEHKHARNDEVAITARCVEYLHFIEIKRLGGDFVLTFGPIARTLNENIRIEVSGNSRSRLEYGLVVQHETHVAEHTDAALLHAQHTGLEINGEIHHTESFLTAYRILGLVKVCTIFDYTDIGRSVKLADKLTAHGAVGHIDDGNRNLTHNLVGVNPGIKQRIKQRHKDKEYQHTLVLNNGAHLVSPYMAQVAETLFYS